MRQALPGLVFALGLLSAGQAHAIVSINLSGSASNSSANLEKTKAHAVSANIGLSLGEYFSLGATHRRSYQNTTGSKRGLSQTTGNYYYVPFSERTETVTNSVDLTIIPYSGIISPFIFGGVAHRDYTNQFDFQGLRTTSKQTLYPVPNYGFGIAISLGRNFTLRVTQTITPGKETNILPDGREEEKEVKDNYTELWLGYKL